MIKPVYTQRDFREGRVGIKFEGNRDCLKNIYPFHDKANFNKGDLFRVINHGTIHEEIVKTDDEFTQGLGVIPFVPEHEIYLVGKDLPTGEDIIPLRFSDGKDNPGDITSSEYYFLVYKKKDFILSAVKSDDFIEFCKQLKIAKVKEKHIFEHNLSSDSLEKAFRFILPPKKKGYKEIYNHKPKQFLELHHQKILKQMTEDLQFDETRTHEYVSLLRTERIINKKFIIKRQPQFFVTDSVVGYSKLITKFTPEAINAMIEDGFIELAEEKYIPGKRR